MVNKFCLKNKIGSDQAKCQDINGLNKKTGLFFVLKSIFFKKDPLIITQRGRAAAVMIGVDAYEKLEYEKELLLLLARGEREIEAGEGYDLDTVFAEADALLATEQS
ncbi:type II toxin-antitoxin system prevent-host-death family antitoxin [uncultured Desulfosarcina sp.]|uniref:type II toxin-antitoxin system prevent-host-death family antitoxin n=1 Tax=uncultured Desulfosarcina sp. TaxID=218289 RepID=UPI0029C7E41D|nr:type II toxin-antitoxin system prevent-host-death family antitoxin [uncultured Desulfosarcina sp.]